MSTTSVNPNDDSSEAIKQRSLRAAGIRPTDKPLVPPNLEDETVERKSDAPNEPPPNEPELPLSEAQPNEPFNALLDGLREWIEIDDADIPIVEFVLAIAVSHRPDVSDPLWGIIITASGGGKSEWVRALEGVPDAYRVGNLSAKGLSSGWRGGGDDPSLFLEMNTKLVLISDMSVLFTKHYEERIAVFGALRESYDGVFMDSKGNIKGKIELPTRYSLIAASTPIIDKYTSEMSVLGERFLRIRYHGQNRKKKAQRAFGNVGQAPKMRMDLKLSMHRFFQRLGGRPAIQKKFDAVKIPEAIACKAVELADFSARARSGVERDSRHLVTDLPHPEEGTRLALQFCKLLKGSAVVHGRTEANEEDLRLVRRVALDGLPAIRLKVLQALVADGPMNPNELKTATGVPYSSVVRKCEDLVLLDVLVSEEGEGETTTYNMVDEYVSLFQ